MVANWTHLELLFWAGLYVGERKLLGGVYVFADYVTIIILEGVAQITGVTIAAEDQTVN